MNLSSPSPVPITPCGPEPRPQLPCAHLYPRRPNSACYDYSSTSNLFFLHLPKLLLSSVTFVWGRYWSWEPTRHSRSLLYLVEQTKYHILQTIYFSPPATLCYVTALNQSFRILNPECFKSFLTDALPFHSLSILQLIYTVLSVIFLKEKFYLTHFISLKTLTCFALVANALGVESQKV